MAADEQPPGNPFLFTSDHRLHCNESTDNTTVRPHSRTSRLSSTSSQSRFPPCATRHLPSRRIYSPTSSQSPQNIRPTMVPVPPLYKGHMDTLGPRPRGLDNHSPPIQFQFLPESPINPIRHPHSFGLFISCLIVTSVMSLAIYPVTRIKARRWCAISLSIFMIYFIFALGFLSYIHNEKPFNCENMRNKFPMYVELKAGNPAFGKVFINGTACYELTHERQENRIYHTYISAEFLSFDSNLGKYVKQSTIPWPASTGVTSIWTSLKPTSGADGTVTGTCGHGIRCLEGKIWMTPNLEFEWIYKNPVTGVMKKTRLASNEGRWYFGTSHRALVSLSENGKEVFRAQSSKTVCIGGGGLDTSLVPVGLMLIAENNYNRL